MYRTVEPSFQDFPDFGGSEFQGAFLDLKGTGYADIVAGFSATDPRSPKQYQVALAIVNPSLPPTTPGFGTELPGFEGNVYTVNAAAHPSLEFSITHFSQLYQQVTGKALTPQTVINIGGFGGSANDTGIGETFAPEQPVTISAATPIPPNPPPSPPILINPHEHRIIDTHHRDLVRVYIFGTSGFAVKDINPATVELNGVHAVAHITRHVKRGEFPFATYVFVADQLNLPAGLTTATLTGQLKTGQTFVTQKDVLNITDSARAFGTLKKKMGNISIYRALAQIEARKSVDCDLGFEHAGNRCVQEPGGPRDRQGQGKLHARPGGSGERGEGRDRKGQGPPGRRHRSDRALTRADEGPGPPQAQPARLRELIAMVREPSGTEWSPHFPLFAVHDSGAVGR